MHFFNIKIAEKYSVNEALFIQNLAHWIEHNVTNGTNFHDGYFWTFNSIEAFTRQYTYFTIDQIRRILEKLLKKEVIKKGNYNQKNYDRTTWYTIIDKDILQLTGLSEKINNFHHLAKLPNGNLHEKSNNFHHLAKIPNVNGKNPKPIPDTIIPDTKKEKREDITSTIITGEPKKEKPLTTQNEGPKNFTEKVELMNSSLSDSESEVKEKKEAPDEARANLFQGEINIKEFSPFSEYFLKEKNLKVKEHHFNFFLKWYNKHKAERLGTSIKAKIYYDILANDFKHAFNTFLENREIEEMQQKRIRQQDSKQDEKLKGLNIPVKSMLDFIDNLRLKAMQQA
jgi:hypothetical protein